MGGGGGVCKVIIVSNVEVSLSCGFDNNQYSTLRRETASRATLNIMENSLFYRKLKTRFGT